ncbi:MAG: NHL repeat-containing protein [Candidatus Sericytochromatia bacterium]
MGFNDATGTSAQFWFPPGIAVDGSGNAYVADENNQRIRKITSGGVVTTLAGSATPGSADGTGTNAGFNYPKGVAVGNGGNVYVADTSNHRVRMITPDGVVSTFAGATSGVFNAPVALTVDAAGNVYVADRNNHRIRMIDTDGVVTTLAGSGSPGFNDASGTNAQFRDPNGVAVDVNGNVYVADTGNHRIRKITPAGLVSTLAGSGSPSFADATGTAAHFYSPSGIAVDAAGNVYVGDTGNQRIRVITPGGAVTTVAGTGTAGSSNGDPTTATFSSPWGLALDQDGYLYVADQDNHRVRKITPSAP